MTWELFAVAAIVVGAVVLFASEKLPTDLVALLVLGSLVACRLVTPEEGVSGFSNPATIAVAALFVLTAGLQKTGATAFLGALLLRFGRNSFLALVVMMTMVGVLSAFVNNTAAVAVFIPLVLMLANRRRIAASRLLLPLSYASQFGGVCTLIGTSTNLLVSSISERAGHGAFSMFEFSRLGLVLFAVGTVYFLLGSRWLLPDRAARDLAATFRLGDYLTEVRVGEGSRLVGRTIHENQVGEEHDVTVVRLYRGPEKTWTALHEPLCPGDVLLVRGGAQQVLAFKGVAGLELNAEFKLGDDTLQTDQVRLVQALVPPHSQVVGHTLKELDFRHRHGALVLGLLRHGENLRDKLNAIRLAVGDALLIQAPAESLEALRESGSLVLLDAVEAPVLRRRKAPLAAAILITVVVLAATGLLPIFVGGILGAIGLVLTRCLTLDEAYAAIDWKVIFLLAGVLPLGLALERTGAAGLLSGVAIGWAGEWGPTAALAALYLLTAVLTELMSNNATAVLLAPVALSAADQLGVDPRPFLIAVTFAASTSFSTPVGYQTNAMVYHPGGYRYRDYLRAGIPLNLIFWLVSVLLIPRLWSFG